VEEAIRLNIGLEELLRSKIYGKEISYHYK